MLEKYTDADWQRLKLETRELIAKADEMLRERKSLDDLDTYSNIIRFAPKPEPKPEPEGPRFHVHPTRSCKSSSANWLRIPISNWTNLEVTFPAN